MRGPAIAVALVAVPYAPVRADETAPSLVRPGYEPPQRLLDSAARTELEKRGLRWDAAYAGEVFVAPQLDADVAADGLFAVRAELDLGTRVAAPLGIAHVEVFAIHGSGLTDELMDVHGVSGNVAERDVRVFEAWYEQPIGAFTLRAGLLAADQEYVLAEQSGTLLGATFGITSQFSANLIGPVYPIATPGASGRLELDAVTARAAIYDGTQENLHGFPTALGSERLAIGELVLHGTFKLGAWHHTDRGHALYAVIDALVAPPLGAFARAGYSPGQFVETYLDAGVRATPRWRSDDSICVALAFAHTSDGAQIVVEAAYEAQIRWLTLQPDVQLVMLRDRTVGVIGTRATIEF